MFFAHRGTTELYKQTFLCLTHLDGSTVAGGLSFTSTNRPLYRTQSLPKSLSILSQSGSSCLGNKMDHLYCIATGNLFWRTVLRCTFALFSFDTAVARYKLAIFPLDPRLCVYFYSHTVYEHLSGHEHMHVLSHIPILAYACPNICLRLNIVKFTWDECVFGPSRPGPIYWLNQGLFKKLIISGPHSYTLFYTLSKKQTNKSVCIYKFCKSLTPKAMVKRN